MIWILIKGEIVKILLKSWKNVVTAFENLNLFFYK